MMNNYNFVFEHLSQYGMFEDVLIHSLRFFVLD